MDMNQLCMGCMHPNTETVCPHCGYVEESNGIGYLPPRSLVGERYLVGRVVHINGEGALYVGYDTYRDVRVWVYEFMPKGIAMRGRDGLSVEHLRGFETQYKTLVADYEALCKTLRGLTEGGTGGLYPVDDLVRENNTVYCIYRYVRAVTFASLIAHNGNQLTWPQTKKLVLSLCNHLSVFHKKGLIHRGISPQTVLIDQNRSVLVFGFSLHALRNRKSAMETEIFPGYAAPEQYEENSWQGAFTDVYAVAALLYRMLTGNDPVEAVLRRPQDTLVPLSELVSGVPENVSDAVMDAMRLDAKERIQSVDEFTMRLLESTNTNTAVFDASHMPPARVARSSQAPVEVYRREEARRRPLPAEPEPPKNENMENIKKYVMRPILITLVLVLLVVGGVVLFHDQLSGVVGGSSSSDSSEPEVLPTIYDGIDVPTTPNFVGQAEQLLKNDAALSQRYHFVFEYAYNEEYKEGVIFEQSTPAGAKMYNVGTVILKVSKGSGLVTVPQVVGRSLDGAMLALATLKIEFTAVEVEDASWSEYNRVYRAEPAPGTQINLETDKVTLYIKKQPKN